MRGGGTSRARRRADISGADVAAPGAVPGLRSSLELDVELGVEVGAGRALAGRCSVAFCGAASRRAGPRGGITSGDTASGVTARGLSTFVGLAGAGTVCGGGSTASGIRQEFSKHSRSARAGVQINAEAAARIAKTMRRDMTLPAYGCHCAASC